MNPGLAGRRLLRPLTARLDGITRRLDAMSDGQRETRDQLIALRDRHAALVQTLETRDAHWEARLAETTAQVTARIDGLTEELQAAELERLRHEVRALRDAQAESIAYLGRQMRGDRAAPSRPPVDG